MKIVFTGASGGHFYPLIAVAEALHDIVGERNLVKPEMYYLSNQVSDEMLLYQNEIEFRHVNAGKLRKYFALKNGTDFFKTLVGFPQALRILFSIYPDVVFTKGGYSSVPVVLAARILRIPVFVHDSDAVPGRANLWAGKFAERINVSYPEAVEYFPHPERVAFTGNPIRRELRIAQTQGAHGYFRFVQEIPTILILGGSQGADYVNQTVLRALPELLNHYQIIHQVGEDNLIGYKELLGVQMKEHEHIERYRVFGSLNPQELRTAGGAADLVISRAGSGAIYEIALWQKPSILVPIPEEVSRDQRRNAYAYARAGATQVIEQHNFTPHVVAAEIERILNDKEMCANMKAGAAKFAKPDAARHVAEEVLSMMLAHER
jgi:UDP-N-acetylglucosamine--N-acetylmuramyl-(pentapeptide) pyrophosphoryl-undecaprenol N-acetylglucosamine transferase